MSRVRLQKLCSLLGLLAILMVTLVPTVSQAMASHPNLPDALATYCTAELATDSSAHDGKLPHSAAARWDACPYCSLFAHVPTLPAGTAALAVAPSVARVFEPKAPREVRACIAYTAAQPRAPPVFS